MAVSMRIPTAVTFGAGTVDKTKVHVALSCDVPALSATSTLTALETAEVPVTGTLTAGATTNCTVTATMDADAITSGDAVTSSAFDLRFTGV
jgi:hypothetical protein